MDDAKAHLAGEDELLVRWLNGGPATRQGVEAYFRHCREQWDTAGPLRAFGIRMGPDEVLVGTIDLRFAGEGLAPSQVNVAYGLYPSWRGRGLATRAVPLASQYAASEGGAEHNRNRRTRQPQPPQHHATTSMVAIASEGRFKRSENLIAKRAARRAGAMPAIARFYRRWRAARPEGGEKSNKKELGRR
ncbi:GNAT family N-acetyltransferase [Actinomadura luteofluorescens]|uniref:GNAT family N-acetyltransferase n=1 Tax=Actinomadura luteofluorescens TaxID=46163 RepID=UPI003D8E681C